MKCSNTMLELLLFLSLLVPRPSSGLPEKNQKKQLLPTEKSMQVDFIYGDLEGHYAIQPSGKQTLISLTSDRGSKSKELNGSDKAFIFSEVDKLPTARKIPTDCARARIDITYHGRNGSRVKKSSCLGLKTVTSESYNHFVGILNLSL